jgi:hypothetical protein
MSQTSENTTYTVGQTVIFTGYSEATSDGSTPILKPNTTVIIQRERPDGGFIVAPVDGGEADVVFPEEIVPLDGEASVDASSVITGAPSPAPAAQETAPKAKATKAAKAEKPVTKKAAATKATPTKAVEATDIETEDAPLQGSGPNASLALGGENSGPALSDSDAVAAMLSEMDALDAAKALIAQSEETYFTLGGVLSHIYHEGIYKRAGFTGKRGFEEYVEAELNVKYRKAMYLINLYTKFRELGVDEKRLTEIGWSKAKELTNYATTANFDDLIEVAKESKNREELVSYLKNSFTGGSQGTGEDQVRKTRVNFVLFADQAETVNRALDVAKEKTGTDNLSQALEYICAEWLSLSENVEVPLEAEIARLSAKYGVQLAVASEVSPSSDQTQTTAA